MRAKNGIISGYDNEVGLFTSSFTVTKTGNGYINGNFDCGGLLTAPNIYNKTQVDNLVSGKAERPNLQRSHTIKPACSGLSVIRRR